MNTSSRAAAAGLDWRTKRFPDLGVVELQNIYMARQLVFVVEQACVYLDVDGYDEASFHVAVWQGDQRLPMAYARLVEPGIKYAEPSMGRVLTTASARGMGLGRELVQRVLTLSDAQFPGLGLRISAQSRLESFYADFGFRTIGTRYLEDGISHTEMFRP